MNKFKVENVFWLIIELNELKILVWPHSLSQLRLCSFKIDKSVFEPTNGFYLHFRRQKIACLT